MKPYHWCAIVFGLVLGSCGMTVTDWEFWALLLSHSATIGVLTA